MAVYYTLFIECYHEQDALRLQEQLSCWHAEINGNNVSMARVDVDFANGVWNIYANPLGPGYSPFGYVEGMNEPRVLEKLEDEIFKCISTGPGIRRAACGYEAQDWFVESGNQWMPEKVDCLSLLFDRNLISPPYKTEVLEFGPFYYRTPSIIKTV